MKRRIMALTLVLAFVVSNYPLVAFAANYTPPTSYGAPKNVGVIFNGDDIGESGYWDFDIGLNASDETRALSEAFADGRFEAAGFDSLGIMVQGDYKLDNGKWRSELPGYDDWVYEQYSQFDAEAGNWAASWSIYNDYFDEVFSGGVLPGGKSYFDSHTMHFRVRFSVRFYHSEHEEHFHYYSPWSMVASYNNDKQVEDPAVLINHAPTLLSVELKQYEDGIPYLDFTANQTHSDVQRLNSISSQRVYTNIWLRVNGGSWVDIVEYMWMKEQFEVEALDYFGILDNYDAAVYEVKFRYSFNYDFYPAAGKSGYVYSPFSNVITHGMPAYEGASDWAVDELNKAVDYGLITDRIKSNMSGKITREEFAEIAVKLYEKYTGRSATAGDSSFTDTTNPEILKAANLGLINGVGNNQYAPGKFVTREEMATILLRAMKVIKPDADFSTAGVSKFADDAKVESWAKDGVYYCAKSKIVNGKGNNLFDPDGNATRQEAVLVCMRAYEFFAK